MEDPSAPQQHLLHRILSHRVLVSVIILLVLAISSYLWLIYNSRSIKVDVNFHVEKSDTLKSIAERLVEDGLIKHSFFFYFSYNLFGKKTPIEPGVYKLSSAMEGREIVYALEAKPMSRIVRLPPNATKGEIGRILAEALGWEEIDRQFFAHTYAGMQWQNYQEIIKEYFQKKYSWNDTKTETFLTLSSLYYDNTYDFMKRMYLPGIYEIPEGSSRAQAASILIDKFTSVNPTSLTVFERNIDNRAAQVVVKLIEEQMVLMPDIVAIPPRDVTLKKSGNRMHLLFTASYWNKGRGPLELVPDPKTKGRKDDHERDVFQRIYSLDGDYTEYLSGKFLWHSPHLHYHFQDFAVYTLEPMGDIGAAAEKQSEKSTFCIRDSEPVDLAHPGANKAASYTICGKERQGISPGWADSYYFTYVDQKFDVTGYPSGTYRLRITINPEDRFKEITKENNIGEVVFDLDAENKTVKILSQKNYGI